VGLETRPPPEERPAPDAAEATPVESRATPPPPEPQPPAADLPPIATKAGDLEAIKKTVDDTAAVGGGYGSYLFVLFYLAVAAGAVTHADLFLENPVKLRFLNTELPLPRADPVHHRPRLRARAPRDADGQSAAFR
jgi:hypothetical protein